MEMQPRDFEILGATKIKDGLFIGDELAAQVPLSTKNQQEIISV